MQTSIFFYKMSKQERLGDVSNLATNSFEEDFLRLTTESNRENEAKAKIMSSTILLNELRRKYNQKLKDSTIIKQEIDKLIEKNGEIRMFIISLFIEKDKLSVQLRSEETIMQEMILKLQQSEEDIELIMKESTDEIVDFAKKYSTKRQLELFSKIRDAQRKITDGSVRHHM